MKKLALVAVAGIALAGCGSSHQSISAPRPNHWQRYPVVIHSPLVRALPRPIVPGSSLHRQAELFSPTRLGIVTVGSCSCPAVPDELTVLNQDTIAIQLSAGTYRKGRLVTHPLPNACTLDFSTTQMLVAIDPRQIDVHRPLTVRLLYFTSTKPLVRTAAPLSS